MKMLDERQITVIIDVRSLVASQFSTDSEISPEEGGANRKAKRRHPASTQSLSGVENPQDSREVANLKVTGRRTGIRSRCGA